MGNRHYSVARDKNKFDTTSLKRTLIQGWEGALKTCPNYSYYLFKNTWLVMKSKHHIIKVMLLYYFWITTIANMIMMTQNIHHYLFWLFGPTNFYFDFSVLWIFYMHGLGKKMKMNEYGKKWRTKPRHSKLFWKQEMLGSHAIHIIHGAADGWMAILYFYWNWGKLDFRHFYCKYAFK